MEEHYSKPYSIDEIHALHDIKNEMEQELKGVEEKSEDKNQALKHRLLKSGICSPKDINAAS